MRLHKLALLAFFASSIALADSEMVSPSGDRASTSVECHGGKCQTTEMHAPPAIILKNGIAIWSITSTDGVPCTIEIAPGGRILREFCGRV